MDTGENLDYLCFHHGLLYFRLLVLSDLGQGKSIALPLYNYEKFFFFFLEIYLVGIDLVFIRTHPKF